MSSESPRTHETQKRKKERIIDIYPGSSTHPKVVYLEALHPIELEFGNVDF